MCFDVEIIAALVNGGFKQAQAETIFSSVDVDNDGFVTYQEIRTQCEVLRKSFSAYNN
jgi:Ca2+-binding EF-hand superfamily protein